METNWIAGLKILNSEADLSPVERGDQVAKLAIRAFTKKTTATALLFQSIENQSTSGCLPQRKKQPWPTTKNPENYTEKMEKSMY